MTLSLILEEWFCLIQTVSISFNSLTNLLYLFLSGEVIQGSLAKAMLSNNAYYQPSTDSIVVPMKQQFQVVNEYYSTTFHEITHSTGHKTRLDRLQTGQIAAFGSEEYSKEELVAEIGSATLMNLLGIETVKTFRNTTAYIQSWLNVLKNDNKFIVSASSKAEKAVNFIIGE